MKRIGISISSARLAAFAWEQSLLSGRPLCAAEVPCTEPYGNREDVRNLASELLSRLGGTSLPPVVLSLPPSSTYLRVLDLPVSDLRNARVIHKAEIEGTLPIDDEEPASDLLPMTGGEAPGGRFLALAARRSVVDRFVALFSEAGFPVDRVVADPVSLLCAAGSAELPARCSVVSLESDAVFLALEGNSIRKARQLPAPLLAHDAALRREAGDFLADSGPVLGAGLAGGPLQEIQSSPPLLPEGFPGRSAIAYGAARVPFSGAIAHGFSLSGARETPDDEADRTSRTRVAAVAVAVAALSCLFALELARWTSSKQLASVRRELRSEFSAAVPEARVVVRETAQIREKIASLQRQRKELGLDLPAETPLLGTISTTLPPGRTLTVKEISIDGPRVRVAGESSGGNAVEGYRGALAAALGKEYSVTVQESRGSARGENVAFTILIEKGGGGRAS